MNRRTQNKRVKADAPAREIARTAPLRTRLSLRAWREQHLYSLFSSLGRLAARPWASTLTLLVMSLALTLPLLFWLLLANARQLSGNVDDARSMSIFLKSEVQAAKATAFADTLRTRAEVATITLKTPEQGLQEFRNQSGFADALKLLESNPLPAVVVLTPDPHASATAISALADELRADPRVDQVQYDAQWRQRLDAILGLATRAAGVLAGLLALGTLLIVGNTVRLDILSRAGEIAVMQMLGASNGFVRRPFLYTGLWYGAFGGILALILIGLVELGLGEPLARLIESYDHRFAVHGLSAPLAAAVFAGSAVLGWFGAWAATSRHLTQGQPQ